MPQFIFVPNFFLPSKLFSNRLFESEHGQAFVEITVPMPKPSVYQISDWYGLGSLCLLSLQDDEIVRRFWSKQEFLQSATQQISSDVYVTASENYVTASENPREWTLYFIAPNDSFQFSSWFYAQSRGVGFRIKSGDNNSLRKWLADNIRGQWEILEHGYSRDLFFRDDADAAMFRLAWPDADQLDMIRR